MKTILIVFASLLMLSGCATIVRGTKEPVSFVSEPSGADVEVENGLYICESTPCSITVPRNINAHAKFEKAGCKARSVPVKGEFSDGTLWLVGNVIFGGLPGIIVDIITGSAKDVSPNPIKAKLDC